MKPPLLGLSLPELAQAIAPVAAQRFRAAQVMRWMTERRAAGFDAMTDLPSGVRAALEERFTIGLPEVEARTPSEDGAEKFLFRLADGAKVEAVYIPAPRHRASGSSERVTVCVSSQAGCAVNCAFCVTGRLGAGRNLTAGEILGQYLVVAREKGFGPREANVVFMGMGEPLLNLAQVSRTLDLLEAEVSPRRTTVSTAGVVPGIRELARRDHRPNLAVSLTAAGNALRTKLMPINAQWPVEELFAALEEWPLEPGRRITFEVVLIAGVNDSPAEARALARLVKRVPSKVNLIPLNESAEWLPGLSRPSRESVDAFGSHLASSGVDVTVRWSKGLGAAAACGQLKGRETPGRLLRVPPPSVRS
ncbi:MAG: 23S rRNA (adenine(2503)-C(2))-methyltransferase RlmN [Holophagales bacterium]|nr:23S rRNA (adenine(2503)-C(2))-methyltransferase RlmN [Holophagales bacterium]